MCDFQDKDLSVTNNRCPILAKFTGILAFGPRMVVKMEFLISPDKYVPLIVGTPKINVDLLLIK